MYAAASPAKADTTAGATTLGNALLITYVTTTAAAPSATELNITAGAAALCNALLVTTSSTVNVEGLPNTAATSAHADAASAHLRRYRSGSKHHQHRHSCTCLL